MKKSGLYDNSIIVLYGDHYGISDTRNLKLASLLGKSSSTWSDFDNTQMQRVPFMIHIPGTKDGGVQTQYGGEIDVLPTLLHLLGIDSRDYIQFGTDLFSSKHDQVVAFRNEDFITPKYTVVGNTIYQNSTGKILTHPSQKVKDEIKKDREKVNTELSLSDTLNNKNLLRFYIPTGFTPVDPKKYNYTNQYGQILKIQEDLGKKSTSLWSKNGNKTTIDDYSSDAPELTTTDQNEANVSSVKNTLKSNKKESIDTSSSSAESDSDQ